MTRYNGVIPQTSQLGALDTAMIADFSSNFATINQSVINNAAASQLAPPPLPPDPSSKVFFRLAVNAKLDSEFDGIPDVLEYQNGNSSSFSHDSDGDGFSDGAENNQGTNPNDANDKPEIEALIVTGNAEAGVEISQKRKIIIPAGSPNRLIVVALQSDEYPSYTSGDLCEGECPFNDQLRWLITLSNGETISGQVDVNDLHEKWETESDTFLGRSPVYFQEVKVVESKPDQDVVVEVEVGATNIEDGALPSTVMVGLLPVEIAPEVLAVNSDFDEGRIDPATGYAIPDCDDVPGVDRKTGAGNGELRIDTEREHLDGLYANDERVTDDMHKGWFGVNPTQLDDDFWDGATVTIRKLDKVDPDTGRKESGQIRFYAKWGDPKFGTYYGIIPYDLQTLAPNNLVTSRVNGKPGEGVYGSTSTIPDDAEFWMEGVRPGKITLEWRLQKGDIDVKHEQTFLVETRKSPQEWKNDLAYKNRLDTDNDPSGQIDVSVDPRGAPREYWTRVERMSEYYDYYQENYLGDDDFQWCGLARLAGSQVISGTSDARFATLTPSAIVFRIVGELIDALSEGGYDIFDSLAWQHHAYRSSGLEALEWTNDNSDDQDLENLLEGWSELDDGINDNDENLIAAAARRMTIYEQQQIIVPTWNKLRAITPVNNEVTNTFTILAENVMKPNGDRFTVAAPGGDLSNTADRWKWIDDAATGSPNGIIGAWKAAGKVGQRALVSKTLRVDSARFSQVPAALRATVGLFPGERSGVQVRDDLDTP